VLRDDTGEPLVDATLVLRPGNRRVAVDSGGRFELTNISAGRYYIEARRIGFRIRGDSIDVSDASGTETELSLDMMAMDECPGFAEVVTRQRPWWKIW